MFQTEIKGINYNLVISLNVEKSKKSRNCSTENSANCGKNVFDRLTELLETISKSSSEYVECLNSVYESPDLKQLLSRLHEINPHVGFRTEVNSSEKESMLRERIKKLTKEKEEMIADQEDVLLKEQDNYDQRVREIIDLHHGRLDSVRKELENKYKSEIFRLKSTLVQPIKSQVERNTPSKSSPRNESHFEFESANESYEAITSHASKSEFDSTPTHDEEINRRDQERKNHVDLSNRMETKGGNSSIKKSPRNPELTIDERLSSKEHVEKLLTELPRSQADGDSFVYPFPIKHNMIFKDDFWTSERRKDMSMVSNLTKNFLSLDSMKKKLQHQGGFSEFKEYCQKNVFPCWEIRCLLRNKRFPSALHRDAHVKKFHPDGRMIFICNFCHWPESSEEALKQHQTTSMCRKRKR